MLYAILALSLLPVIALGIALSALLCAVIARVKRAEGE